MNGLKVALVLFVVYLVLMTIVVYVSADQFMEVMNSLK